MFERRVQRTFDAIHRKDVAAVMRGWAEDGVLEFPGPSALGGRYEGRPAIEAFFQRWFERMETIQITVKHVGFANPVKLTYGSTMYVEFETDQRTTDGISFKTDVTGVYRFRHGKLVLYREFLFDPSQAEAIWGPADRPQAT